MSPPDRASSWNGRVSTLAPDRTSTVMVGTDSNLPPDRTSTFLVGSDSTHNPANASRVSIVPCATNSLQTSSHSRYPILRAALNSAKPPGFAFRSLDRTSTLLDGTASTLNPDRTSTFLEQTRSISSKSLKNDVTFKNLELPHSNMSPLKPISEPSRTPSTMITEGFSSLISSTPHPRNSSLRHTPTAENINSSFENLTVALPEAINSVFTSPASLYSPIPTTSGSLVINNQNTETDIASAAGASNLETIEGYPTSSLASALAKAIAADWSNDSYYENDTSSPINTGQKSTSHLVLDFENAFTLNEYTLADLNSEAMSVTNSEALLATDSETLTASDSEIPTSTDSEVLPASGSETLSALDSDIPTSSDLEILSPSVPVFLTPPDSEILTSPDSEILPASDSETMSALDSEIPTYDSEVLSGSSMTLVSSDSQSRPVSDMEVLFFSDSEVPVSSDMEVPVSSDSEVPVDSDFEVPVDSDLASAIAANWSNDLSD